jgi:hypothetical protein
MESVVCVHVQRVDGEVVRCTDRKGREGKVREGRCIRGIKGSYEERV